MKRASIVIAALIAICISTYAFSRKAYDYEFKEFMVKEPYPGPAVKEPKPRSKWARTYRTRIAHEYKEGGQNFAGHFSLVTWGCGTDCVSFAIVDATTGEVFDPPFEGLTNVDGKGHSFEGLVFEKQSELLIASGCPEEKNCGVRYYRWHDHKLELLPPRSSPKR
jgi:hypothetical protein